MRRPGRRASKGLAKNPAMAPPSEVAEGHRVAPQDVDDADDAMAPNDIIIMLRTDLLRTMPP